MIEALNRLVTADDLIAVMTPDMSASGLTFTRRTGSIEQMLSGLWGTKGWIGTRDALEVQYESVLRPAEYRRWTVDGARDDCSPPQMLTLNALDELIQQLRGLREERKAVITVTDGWLREPDRNLAKPLIDPKTDGVITGGQTQVPVPKIGRDPLTGRIAPRDPGAGTMISNDGISEFGLPKCENDRMMLSELSHNNRFITMMQSANRANVSFYPVDPDRLFSGTHTLIDNHALELMVSITDGLRISESALFESGLRRIVDDLSNYYLLGLLLHGGRRRDISQDQCAREAAGRTSARPCGLSGRETGRDRQADDLGGCARHVRREDDDAGAVVARELLARAAAARAGLRGVDARARSRRASRCRVVAEYGERRRLG